MIIGTCSLELRLWEVNSLKEKRHILKSIIQKLRNQYNVSVAEVDLQDKWKSAILGVACVTNETAHAHSIISTVINFVERDVRIELVDCQVEIL